MADRRILLALIIGFAIQAPLMAVVIDNTNTTGYVTGPSNYTGVVQILFNKAGGGTYICSGALVSPTQILTAGHCISGAYNWNVTFQTPSGNTVMGVSGSFLDPLFGPMPSPLSGLDYYDVGLLTLSAAAPPDAEIYQLHLTLSDFAFGTSTVDMAGYGLGGNPSVGYLGLQTRRHAQNTVSDEIGSLNGVSTPDLPLAAFLTFTYGNSGGGTGLPNGGDSGGPLLFNDQIIGVTSFGDLPRPGSGSYENGVQYLGAFANIANPVIGNWVESELVPEPGTWALMALGALALCTRLTRRAGRRIS